MEPWLQWETQHVAVSIALRQERVALEKPELKYLYIYIYMYVQKFRGQRGCGVNQSKHIYTYLTTKSKYTCEARSCIISEWSSSAWFCVRYLPNISSFKNHSDKLLQAAAAIASSMFPGTCSASDCRVTAIYDVITLPFHALRVSTGYSTSL